MRISDWSSDVCSSDLVKADALAVARGRQANMPGWAAKFRATMAERKRPRVDVGRSRSSRAKSRDGSKHVSTSLDTNGYGIIMCGIIGILGKDEVTDRLVEGLRRLDNRGYDSAGDATIVDGHIEGVGA